MIHSDSLFLKSHEIKSEQEISDIVEKRTNFYRKASTIEITREECYKQIQIEKDLMNLCLFNMKNDIKLDSEEFKKECDDVSFVFSNRICNLYYSTLRRFDIEIIPLKDFLMFRQNYNQFLTENGYSMVEVIMEKRCHPEVYIEVSLFEYNVFGNVKSAKACLERGLKYYKKYKRLHLEEFWITIQSKKINASKLSKIILKFNKLISIFSGDLEFHTIILDRAMLIKNLTELQYYIIRDMIEKYFYNAYMWQKLATLSIDGVIYQPELNKISYEENDINKISNCIQTYEMALKKNLPPSSKSKLWNIFLNEMIDIWKKYSLSIDDNMANFVFENMHRVFENAHQSGVLKNGLHYLYWAECTSEDKVILSKAIEMNKNNLNNWIDILEYYIDHDCYEIANTIFRDGVKSLENDSLPLWEAMELYIHNSYPNQMVKFYKKGLRSPYDAVHLLMKVSYLKWFYSTNGLKKTRVLFKDLTILKPYSKELYQKMIFYEKNCNPMNKQRIRKLFEKVCHIFGQDFELWLEFIQFEITYGNKYVATQIYNSASQIINLDLRPELTNFFISAMKRHKSSKTKSKDIEFVCDDPKPSLNVITETPVDEIIVIDDDDDVIIIDD